jgi:hypothetical protein
MRERNRVLRRIDLTREFHTYRDAARLVWNIFLRDCADREDVFPEIDEALFHAILESRIDRELKRTKGEFSYYPSLQVRSPAKKALFLSQEAGFNVWREGDFSKRLSLRFVGLFDFAASSGVNRDFEYIQCVVIHEGVFQSAKDNVLLIRARDTRISYMNAD